MIVTEIKESDWKYMDQIELVPRTPYWFKKPNGNIVMSVWYSTNESSGWAVVYFDERFNLKTKPGEFHILKGAKVQPALLQQP